MPYKPKPILASKESSARRIHTNDIVAATANDKMQVMNVFFNFSQLEIQIETLACIIK
jgi:hypothetical protein